MCQSESQRALCETIKGPTMERESSNCTAGVTLTFSLLPVCTASLKSPGNLQFLFHLILTLYYTTHIMYNVVVCAFCVCACKAIWPCVFPCCVCNCDKITWIYPDIRRYPNCCDPTRCFTSAYVFRCLNTRGDCNVRRDKKGEEGEGCRQCVLSNKIWPGCGFLPFFYIFEKRMWCYLPATSVQMSAC